MRKITKVQAEYLCFIKDFKKKNGFPPTRAEIAITFSVHKHAADCIIRALEKKGYIDVIPKISRGIVIRKKRLDSDLKV
jgi:repressor LexA